MPYGNGVGKKWLLQPDIRCMTRNCLKYEPRSAVVHFPFHCVSE